MSRTTQTLTVGSCIVMLVWLVLLQFVLTPDVQAPWSLFFLFGGLWAFAAVAVWFWPQWGSAGTMLWGVLSAVSSFLRHDGSMANWVIIVLSLVPVVLAGIVLWQVRSEN